MDTSSGSINAAASTMSLYQKYSDLSSGIEKARQERSRLEQRMVMLREEIARFEQEDEVLLLQTQEAEKEALIHKAKMEEREDSLSELEKKNSQLVQQRRIVEMRQNTSHQVFRNYQKKFLQDSIRFRQKCKRLRLRASALGLSNTYRSAYAIAICGAKIDSINPFDTAGEYTLQGRFKKNQEHHKNEYIAEEWKVPEYDVALIDALKEYQTKKNALTAVQDQVDSARVLLKQADQDKMGAVGRQIQCQDQLNRIVNENTKMKQKIQELLRSSEEVNSLAKTFSSQTNTIMNVCVTTKKARHEEAIVRSNPYLKKTVQCAPPKQPALARLQEPPLPVAFETMVHSQQRKRRRQSNFGSSLVIAGDVLHSPGEEGNEVCPPPQPQAGSGFPIDSSRAEKRTGRDIPTMTERDLLLQSLLHDDDDDNLLSFVSFPKCK